ncbi:MAG: nucleotidyltransferase domain-containing protein [Methanocellales archaeon]|nr:nucleotidyltransferase domain-containing protein [Methanocellales archaeon]MDD3291850.1 nucleotidyltransferase domain-containing protein [Methanocellales archaeon]MDD5235493.1 nucleotidyltransferase domain-containing protein [Methanocellales archaeon]MDD5485112.1 nucleotidyltransferase domain-containing protein [Methanocellales archaeon]
MKQDIASILKKLLDKCKEKFGVDLISVVLFGSYATGVEHEYSDVDLLIIAENLSYDWRKRDEIATDLKTPFVFEKKMDITLIDKKDLVDSMKWFDPLVLGISEAYVILYDKKGFFGDKMKKFKEKVKEMHVKKIGDNSYEIPVGDLIEV